MKFIATFFSAVAALRLDADKNRPVSKVITLLKDMQSQLQKEADEDQAMYDKLACFCEKNDKEKTQTIKDSEQRIEQLTSAIEAFTADSSRLSTEIKVLEGEISENQAALDKATAIREKQLADFNAEEKDMLQSIQALKSAVTVLSKHHSQEALLAVAALLQKEFTSKSHQWVLKGHLTPTQRKAVTGFIQQPTDYALLQQGQPAFKQAYAPQSGEIFGILQNMKDTFEANLAETQKEEQTNQKSFEELKAAKEEEIKAGQEQLSQKQNHLASTDEKNAQAKEDIEDTRNSLSADEKFLMELKLKCQATDHEWEERQKTRNEEIQAVSEALAVLASDDAHDTFTRTFNFLQLRATLGGDNVKKTKASAVLAQAAEKLNKPELAALASRVRLDAFTKVKAAIDDMVTQLLKEKDDEIKHRDWCVEELHQNERTTEEKQRDKDDTVAKIDDFENTITTLTGEIDNLHKEVANLQVEIKRAGENRETENKDFQDTVADQRETQRLLTQAVTVLKGFYDKKALLQRQPAMPENLGENAFGSYKSNGGANGVMSLLQQIISDAKMMEQEAINAEKTAQQAYESFIKNSNKVIEEKNTESINKTESKAQAEQDRTEAEQKRDNLVTELEQLSNSNADVHRSCDFVLKNFEIRQEARDQEVEALRQAKAILSGAQFS